MRLDPLWTLRGYFDFSEASPTPSQAIRDDLARALGMKPGDLRIHVYPVGPVWKHTVWWREEEPDYAEAQFFMRIPDFAILSLGLSIEKGLEVASCRPEERLDRGTWDWPRFVARCNEIVTADLPGVATALSRPINARFRIDPRGQRLPELDGRAFSLLDGIWYQRRRGQVDPAEICAYVQELDKQIDCWVIAHMAVDLTPAEVAATSTAAAATILAEFNGARRRLRGAA